VFLGGGATSFLRDLVRLGRTFSGPLFGLRLWWSLDWGVGIYIMIPPISIIIILLRLFFFFCFFLTFHLYKRKKGPGHAGMA
jgi:hypothetical protein